MPTVPLIKRRARRKKITLLTSASVGVTRVNGVAAPTPVNKATKFVGVAVESAVVIPVVRFSPRV